MVKGLCRRQRGRGFVDNSVLSSWGGIERKRGERERSKEALIVRGWRMGYVKRGNQSFGQIGGKRDTHYVYIQGGNFMKR